MPQSRTLCGYVGCAHTAFYFFEHFFGLFIAMDFLAQGYNPDWPCLPYEYLWRSITPIGFQCA